MTNYDRNYLYEDLFADTPEIDQVYEALHKARQALGDKARHDLLMVHPIDWMALSKRFETPDRSEPPIETLFGYQVMVSSVVPEGEIFFANRPAVSITSFIKPDPVPFMPLGYRYRADIKPVIVKFDPVPVWEPYPAWMLNISIATTMIVLTIIVWAIMNGG